MMRLASRSSIGVLMKMIRSLRRREKMSVGALAAAGLFDYYGYDGHLLFCR